MMKVKLNQGTDYKTGAFSKEQSNSSLCFENASVATNKTKRKDTDTARKQSKYSQSQS